MSRHAIRAPLSLAGFLRILFRWKLAGLAVFSVLFLGALAAAIYRPLNYESQVFLERKPVRVTPVVSRQEDEEFDVYRLTSESQRSVALLKSRFMMERWMDALGLSSESPLEKEQDLAKLTHSVTVQPVSYTDLFVLKVKAHSPEEAARRAGLLATAFAQWDMEQNRATAEELRTLLQSRMKDLSTHLGGEWTRLKNQKSSQMLSLSGSSMTRQTEAELTAREKLYDNLTTELDEAERELTNGQLTRTRILTPPSLPGKPVISRRMKFVLGMLGSAFTALACMFFLEWQDPTIRRTQDIALEVPSYPVLAVPSMRRGKPDTQTGHYLGLLADAVGEHLRSKEPAVVQFVSPSAGDGKSMLSASLARLLAPEFNVCVVHQSPNVEEKPAALAPRLLGSNIHAVDLSLAEPLAKPLRALQKLFQVLLLDSDSPSHIAPGSNLAQEADLICILVTAGRTSRYYLRALRSHLERFPNQNLLFILNRYKDPLPLWLQTP